MAWCTPDDVKSYVTPESVSDGEISDIIDLSYSELKIYVGDVVQDNTLKLANAHHAAANVIRKMKFTGELANSVKFGNNSQSNNVEADIKYHKDEALRLVKLYKTANTGSGKILYGRVGIGTVNKENYP